MTQTSTQTVHDAAICQVRLIEKNDDRIVIGIVRTNYRIHLSPVGMINTEPGRRIHGVIALPVWKVDRVSAGGWFIDPVFGRPRRVQGRVVQSLDSSNQLVVSLGGCVMLANLPSQYKSADYPGGSRIALDVRDEATFAPTESPDSGR